MTKWVKKIAAVILAVLMLVSVLYVAIPDGGIAMKAEAASIVSSGTFGDDNSLSWSLDSYGELVIDGTGVIPFTNIYNPAPWDKSMVKTLTIGPNVTGISDRAFYGCNNLSQIKSFGGVTFIEWSAFCGCPIENLIIDENVKTIGDNAFKGCGVVNAYIGPGVESIGFAAFYECGNLKNVYISDDVTNWSDDGYFFQGCGCLENVYLGSGLSTIPENTFYNCSSLKSIFIPKNIKRIDYAAFGDCGLNCCYYEGTQEEWNNIEFNAVAFGGSTRLKEIKYNSSFDGDWINSEWINGDYYDDFGVKEPFVHSGVFYFNSNFEKNGENKKNLNYTYTYDENWFGRSAYEYQHDLTRMSIRMAMASIGNMLRW